MCTPTILGIPKGTRIYPDEGLEDQCHYLVEVASTSSNVIHRCLMYTGFLDSEGLPTGHIYNSMHEPECNTIREFYYIKVINKAFNKGFEPVPEIPLRVTRWLADFPGLPKTMLWCDKHDQWYVELDHHFPYYNERSACKDCIVEKRRG